MVSATSWSSKLSTPRSHRHRFCMAIARFSGGSLDHRNPTGAQRASSAICVPACGSDCLPASPHTHAPHPHTQTGPPFSATRPSLILFSRPVCPRVCDSDSLRCCSNAVLRSRRASAFAVRPAQTLGRAEQTILVLQYWKIQTAAVSTTETRAPCQ